MTSLVEHKNPTIRTAAIKNLTTYLNDANIEAVRALLPWLSNPNWASDIPNGRGMLISALGKVDLPESVPGLITILMNEEEFRQTAAEALARYKDPRAVPALRFALANEKNPVSPKYFYQSPGRMRRHQRRRKNVLARTLCSDNFDARRHGEILIRSLYGQYDENDEKPQIRLPVALNIGNFVAEQTEPSDGLAMRAIERLKTLRKTKPAVAAALAGIMQKWKGRVIFIERLRQIKTGEADLETILTALAQRKEIREKIENEIFAMRAAPASGAESPRVCRKMPRIF